MILKIKRKRTPYRVIWEDSHKNERTRHFKTLEKAVQFKEGLK